MDITFVTKGSFDEIFLRHKAKLHKSDILVFSEGILDPLNLVVEAGGGSDQFIKLCALSKELGCVLVAGCDTEVYGILHKSVLIIDEGQLLGVSDMAHVLDETKYAPGGGFRVYDTSRGKIGLLVGEDLYFPEVSRILTLCDSDVILSIFGHIRDHMPQVMLRAEAFSNGVNMCMAARGYVQIADIKGEMICAMSTAILEYNLEVVKDYHLIQSRRRGCYREIYSSFDF